ncbi:MAG: TfoX/Sxy family protein [Gammaproteobacteria bacterium]|nr:TfoX/Sxy family protein [Gammaproteobacteria bacterium]
MFGGYGIYQRDTIFAIIIDDRLYFKTDSLTCAAFTARGLRQGQMADKGQMGTFYFLRLRDQH